MNIYETPRLVAEYLLFHYGAPEEILPWDFGPAGALGFPLRSVRELLSPSDVPGDARALDLGCAVGRSAYELARHAREVIGIDYSHAFIEYAERLRLGEAVTYPRADEAAQSTQLTAKRPEDDKADPASVAFEQGDAMHLRADLGDFDIVHAANLLCRLTEPALLLARLPELVRPGGQLLLTTPCTWLEEFTPSEHWPKGRTLDWLQQTLAPHFVLEMQLDLPFLIREHARKFQWSVALGTRWRRR